ncbi:MAG: O-antigen ligase family protein [bacterium]|nr:O-antigen ligase family protein [bacterium]
MEKAEITRFDWLQVIVLGVVSPLFLFPREKFAWILFLIPLLWVTRKIINKEFIQQTILDIPLLIILVQVLSAALLRGNPSHSLPKAAGLLLGIALFYAVNALLQTETWLKRGIFLFLLGGSFFSFIGLLGMFTFKVKHLTLLMKLKELLPRINFKLPGAEEGFHPNAVGGTLILVVPLFMVLLYAYWKNKHKGFFFLSAGLAVTFAVLLLTQSRGAWLGLLLACGIVFFLAFLKKKTLVIVSLVVVLVVMSIAGPLLMENNQVKLTTRQVEGTLFFRVQMWDIVMPMIHAHPLVGAGLNEFRYHPEVKYRYSHPHNKLLLLAVELGLPGVIAYLALLACMAFAVTAVWRKNGDTFLSWAALGLGCGQLAHFIFEMTDAVPFGAKVNVFSWLSLALIAAIYNFTLKAKND